MLAEELIDRAKPVYQQYNLRDDGKAWVKAYTRDGKDWWHVHSGELLPEPSESSRVVVVLVGSIEVLSTVLLGKGGQNG